VGRPSSSRRIEPPSPPAKWTIEEYTVGDLVSVRPYRGSFEPVGSARRVESITPPTDFTQQGPAMTYPTSIPPQQPAWSQVPPMIHSPFGAPASFSPQQVDQLGYGVGPQVFFTRLSPGDSAATAAAHVAAGRRGARSRSRWWPVRSSAECGLSTPTTNSTPSSRWSVSSPPPTLAIPPRSSAICARRRPTR
jgi:hypothetical protein